MMGCAARLAERFIRQGFPCLFRCLTGMYCPGCGGTRAVVYLLRGDIVRSLWYHPLVGYMAAVAAAELGYYIFMSRKKGKVRRTGVDRFFGHYEAEVYVGIGIIVINWAVKNWVLLVMGIKLIP